MRQPNTPDDLCVSRPSHLDGGNLLGHRHIVRTEFGIHECVAHGKAQHAVPLQCVKSMCKHQRLQHGPPAFSAVRGIASHQPRQPLGIECGDTCLSADLGDHISKGHSAGATVQPMPTLPGGAVGPQISARGEGRIGPCIPTPHMCARHVYHPTRTGPAQRLARRIVGRIAPVFGHRTDVGGLQRIVPATVREIRQHRLRTHRIQELVRLVRRLVQRRASHLGEPDRL